MDMLLSFWIYRKLLSIIRKIPVLLYCMKRFYIYHSIYFNTDIYKYTHLILSIWYSILFFFLIIFSCSLSMIYIWTLHYSLCCSFHRYLKLFIKTSVLYYVDFYFLLPEIRCHLYVFVVLHYFLVNQKIKKYSNCKYNFVIS